MLPGSRSSSREPFTDDTLEAWQATQSLPQIMEVENWQQALTADKVGDEFDTQYILKTAGDSYKRADLIAATDASLIVPLNFPEAPEVTDPIAAEDVSLDALKHWELAPFNARLLVEADIEFALTSGADPGFWSDLREAVASGLSEADAINALTSVPAAMLGASDRIRVSAGKRTGEFSDYERAATGRRDGTSGKLDSGRALPAQRRFRQPGRSLPAERRL